MSRELEAIMRRSRRLHEEIFGREIYAVADELVAAVFINHRPGLPRWTGSGTRKSARGRP